MIAGRYVLADLLTESPGGWFWRAEDPVLGRHVTIHIVAADDPRAEALMAAARDSARLHDRRVLRVLDAECEDEICYVVNEWGDGTSLDIKLLRDGPLSPRKAAWVTAEAASVLALAHDLGIAHGRLTPENILFDPHGNIRVIGLAVEAALYGLPAGRKTVDVTDLVAILYAGLTGRWAGVSTSAIPLAMQSGGRVLSPRKVQPGIPRVLDEICEQVLCPSAAHARATYDVHSARALVETLDAFVGDPAGLAEAGAVLALPLSTLPGSLPATEPPVFERPVRDAPTPSDAQGTAVLPVAPDYTGASTPEPTAVPASGLASTTTPADHVDDLARDDLADSVMLEPVDQPTQAGMPVFEDDTDAVGWISRTPEAQRPPPAFAEPEAKPLFAPEPAAGEPVRRTRPGVTAPNPEDYWPWGENSRSESLPGVTTSSQGLKIIENDEDDTEIPGRSWFRLAVVIGSVTLLLVAGLVVWNVINGRPLLTLDPNPEPSPTPTRKVGPTLETLTGLKVSDFDPPPGNGNEHPETVANVVDGDPATTWTTMQYKQQFGPGGIKPGVGLVLDLGGVRQVRRVDVSFVGEPTGVQLFVTKTAPTSLDGLTPVTTQQAGQKLSATVKATGQYVVVWLTSLPTDGAQFRGGVAEVSVRAVAS